MTFGETRVVQWWVRLVGAILLLLLVFLAYARVGAAGFIWDDESHLTQNPCIVGPLRLGRYLDKRQRSALPACPYHLLGFFIIFSG